MHLRLSGIDESKLKFSKPLRLRPIVFETKACKLWRLRGPYYLWSTRIKPRGL